MRRSKTIRMAMFWPVILSPSSATGHAALAIGNGGHEIGQSAGPHSDVIGSSIRCAPTVDAMAQNYLNRASAKEPRLVRQPRRLFSGGWFAPLRIHSDKAEDAS